MSLACVVCGRDFNNNVNFETTSSSAILQSDLMPVRPVANVLDETVVSKHICWHILLISLTSFHCPVKQG
ncbi:hypothetical protein TNIN_376351 [Trichonephila inaurata madagascariensis]|uniref:Uncharacterized protein n=1 Tax=Trichonephila inaurata madagascariensis TaxID=2747483 RepID=A0A8X7CSF6_9ARAC|nr:hypothetical protein TNIN_376351 [Trichonephila inaurata madagascariensis]